MKYFGNFSASDERSLICEVYDEGKIRSWRNRGREEVINILLSKTEELENILHEHDRLYCKKQSAESVYKEKGGLDELADYNVASACLDKFYNEFYDKLLVMSFRTPTAIIESIKIQIMALCCEGCIQDDGFAISEFAFEELDDGIISVITYIGESDAGSVKWRFNSEGFLIA